MILFYWLITTMPFMQHPFWARYAGGLTMTKYLGGACVLYAVAYLTQRRTSPRYMASPQAKCFVAFIALAAISFMHGAAFTWQSQIVSYVSFVMLFFATLTVVDSARRLRWVMLVSIGSVAWASLYMIREWQKSIAIYGLSYRPGWVTGDSNYFSVSAVLVLPICACFVLQRARTWERYYALGCAGATLLALMLGGSRGGFVALIVSAVVFTATAKRRVAAFAAVSVLLLAATLVTPASPIRRLLNPNHSDKYSSDLRIQLWHAAFSMIRAHPLAGVGLDDYGKWIKFYGVDPNAVLHVAHNTYLHLAAEMGGPGLLAFLLMMALMFLRLNGTRRLARREGDKFTENAIRGVQAGLAGFATAAFFVSVQQSRFFWLMLALSCVQRKLIIRSRSKDSSPEAPNLHSVSFTQPSREDTPVSMLLARQPRN